MRSAVARPSHTELLVAGAEFALGYLGGADQLPDRLVMGEPQSTRYGDHDVTAQVLWRRGTGASGTQGPEMRYR